MEWGLSYSVNSIRRRACATPLRRDNSTAVIGQLRRIQDTCIDEDSTMNLNASPRILPALP